MSSEQSREKKSTGIAGVTAGSPSSVRYRTIAPGFNVYEGDISLITPDIHEAAERAVIYGSGAVAQGPEGVAAGEGGIAVGHDVSGEIVVVGYDTAFERVLGSTSFVLDQLKVSYTQTRDQAQGWFHGSLVAASVGFILVGAGAVAVILGHVTTGVITVISSIVPNAVAALFFVQSKKANERVDAILRSLTEARELTAAVEIANTVQDPEARDRLKSEIVQKALRLQERRVMVENVEQDLTT